MTLIHFIAAVSLLASGVSLGAPKSANDTGFITREWTNTGGKRIKATYLGVRGTDVFLKLQNGKITPLPLSKLSEADNKYIKGNRFEYHEAWRGWPGSVRISASSVSVSESEGDPGEYIYETPHFRFKSNVNLGNTLMKDLAMVFELTYQLHLKSPFGILAKPENELFEAMPFGTRDEYLTVGGPANSAGVYMLKDKVFKAPLDLMGVKSGSAGWRRVSKKVYNTSTIVHELTHMLAHDMLDTLPLWVNEGFAEYIARMPVEGNSFRTGRDQIKKGVLDHFVRGYEKSKRGRLGASQRRDYLMSDNLPELFHVAKVMTMTDAEWRTGSESSHPIRGQLPRMPKLYRTAHLIVYYFIQIEGQSGVAKLQRFLGKNRAIIKAYHQYRMDFAAYQKKMREFVKLPGVSKLEGGRIRHPSNLKPPKAPEPPCKDPKMVKMGGLQALLGGETPETVGKRIESALVEHFGVNLRFGD